MSSRPAAPESPARVPFAIGLALGSVLIGFGVWSLLRRHVDARQFGEWFVGGVLAHDLLLAPLVLVGGRLLRRVVRGPRLVVLQAALLLSALIVLFSVPAVLGKGRAVPAAGKLPTNYRLSLAVIVAVIWAVALAVMVLRERRRFRAPRG